MHVHEIDVLVHSTDAPLTLPEGEPTDVDDAIARHAVGDGGDHGLHSEMFTDGCMRPHRAGKVTNRGKGQYDGVSVTTFAFGSPHLYAWLDGNESVAFPPVEIANSPEVIGANTHMVSVNGALAIDVDGQVVAACVPARRRPCPQGDEYMGGKSSTPRAIAAHCRSTPLGVARK